MMMALLFPFVILFSTVTPFVYSQNFSSLQSSGPLDNSESSVYQDRFCLQGVSNPSQILSPNDPRFGIRSFAVLHGRLYIFSSIAIFNVSLDEPGPPFYVNESLLWTDFSGSLTNMMYKTAWITSRLFTSVGIELDNEKELLVLGYAVVSYLHNVSDCHINIESHFFRLEVIFIMQTTNTIYKRYHTLNKCETEYF